jgi:prevent-host-death family protein
MAQQGEYGVSCQCCDPRAHQQTLWVEIAIHYAYSYSRMKVSAGEAKNKLPKLIKAVEDGESVTIYRHGMPVVDIVRTTKAHPERPRFGTLKGKVTALDPDWWEPMTNDEVRVVW